MTGDWHAHAACRGTDLTVFFPDNDGDIDLTVARALCRTCPVQVDCLDEARRLRDGHGFRGGMTGDERIKSWGVRRRQVLVPAKVLDTVPSLGARRRRQALACIGHSLTDIAPLLRVEGSTVSSHLERPRILRSTHERWCWVYEQMRWIAGTNTRSQAVAVKQGWAPPWAWPGTSIDDPDATPQFEREAA